MTTIQNKILVFIVSMLPKPLIYSCAMRVLAHATMGKYSKTGVPELTAMDALKRYGDDYNI